MEHLRRLGSGAQILAFRMLVFFPAFTVFIIALIIFHALILFFQYLPGTTTSWVWKSILIFLIPIYLIGWYNRREE